MTNKLALLVPGLLALGAPRAQASERYPLYDIPAASLDREAKVAVRKVVRACGEEADSRMGPSPLDIRRCNDAVGKALPHGVRAATAALAAIDRIGESDDGRAAVGRLYDLVARSGDLKFLEPLVGALEREQKNHHDDAVSDRSDITLTLSMLTYAEPKGAPAAAWRTWLSAHPNPIRAALLAERLTQIEAQLARGDFDELITAARFLGTQPGGATRARGILDGLAARPALTHAQTASLRRARARLPREIATQPSAGKPTKLTSGT